MEKTIHPSMYPAHKTVFYIGIDNTDHILIYLSKVTENKPCIITNATNNNDDESRLMETASACSVGYCYPSCNQLAQANVISWLAACQRMAGDVQCPSNCKQLNCALSPFSSFGLSINRYNCFFLFYSFLFLFRISFSLGS